MKIFCIITCLLIFALSQQVVYAQQSPATEPTEESAEGFVKLGIPLEEALTKITFVSKFSKERTCRMIVFKGEGVTREKDYIQLTLEEVYCSYYTLLSK